MSADPGYTVHPSACVDDGATIGEGTRIWHFSHVCAGARIGRESSLGQGVFVAGGVEIGDRVRIQNNVSVYDGVIVEDDVFLGPAVVFTNVKYPRAPLSRKGQWSRTIVQRGATIGANATIVCGVTIGAMAFIGAGAVVTKNVEAHALVVGVPARQSGWVGTRGRPLVQRADLWVCPESNEAYVSTGGRLQKVTKANGS